MAYHTGIYLLLFLPAVLLLYQLTPKKSRWITLLAAGYLFFWICSGKLVLYLLGTTLFTHYIAVWISWIKTKCNDETAGMQRTEAGTIKKAYKKKEKAILVFGICVLLGILAYLKYYNFFIQNVNVLLAQGGSSLALGTKHIILYAAGNWIYGRCILGKGGGVQASWKDRSFSGLFSTNYGRSDQFVCADSRYVI